MGNKRDFFRLDFYDVAVEVQVEEVIYHGRVRDISGNGIGIYLQENVELKECVIRFTLQEEPFQLAAFLIRKKYTGHGETLYACTFPAIEEKVQSKLMSTLLKLDVQARKKEQ